MSIFDDAQVTMLLADYMAADSSGKIAIFGAAFPVSGVQPTGFTAAQYVGVIIRVPSRYAGQQFSLELQLRDEDDNAPVAVPGPTGQSENLQIAQVVTVMPLMVANLYVPGSVDSTIQSVIGFPNGLPLSVGKNYAWHVSIDGHTQPHWAVGFHVPGPPPGPVFGGPAGPTNIPNIRPPA